MDTNIILARAKQIAKTQGRLARSPAELNTDGKLDLCAGSCIAKAILELSGDSELLLGFDDLLMKKDKLQLLPFIFERHGLSGESAKRVVAENDVLSDDERLPWFSSLTLF